MPAAIHSASITSENIALDDEILTVTVSDEALEAAADMELGGAASSWGADLTSCPYCYGC